MASGIMTRAQFTDLDDSNFRKIYSDVYGKYKVYYENVFQMETSDRDEEKYSGVAGHGLMTPIDENGTSDTDKRIPDYSIDIVNQTYSLNSEISYERFQDDRFGEIKKEASILGESARKTPDVYAADAYKNGFTTTDRFGGSQLAADGLRFFSTLHIKSKDATSTTMSNASSTGITLTEDNIDTALVAVREQLNEQGLIAGCEAKILLVPPKLAKQARIITESTQRPDTSDNDINIYKGGSLTVIEWPELGAAAGGSDTAWYLIDPVKNKLIFQWREHPTVFPVEFEKNPYRYVYDCLARWEYGMQNWRGVWGSAGDGSVYAA